MENILDIEDNSDDYNKVYNETFRAELGIRAVCFMYHDHSDDKKSYENILQLKDNIQYRLFSATHQYLVFLRELSTAEDYLQSLYQKNPRYIDAFPMGNPYFDKVEQELSSVFDNIIFQISSVFDYLSHVFCYATFKNKSKTLYWTKLASTARGGNNELSGIDARKVIDLVDRRFVGKLYDYRSRQLHNKRDKHNYKFKTNLRDLKFKVIIHPSDLSLKHFSLINKEAGQNIPTLTYLSSWIIKRSFFEIGEILSSLATEIRKNSSFYKNIVTPKNHKDIPMATYDPATRTLEPSSDGLWNKYKTGEY